MDDTKILELLQEEGEKTRRHFDIVADGLRSDLRAIGEGVLGANQRLDRHSEEVTEEFAEVRAMIKFSFTDLDRRIVQLEQLVQNLAQRVQRLESQ